ncbi:MAG: bifunctional UDP-N-acetylglucosamine diphosphorylase/glucosamine-1-phosphate N-acetyltransferase GlmU [Synergistaceae bacterium]|nr:bifunctional UDP-N-acetylglucosamine diphosphorylase/glucosamine-1-phosphate N-acetyltransferase GlmU [Synergistaceae bacterium]
MQDGQKEFCVLILAAGKGTRMRSKTPKVLHKIMEEPLLYYPLSELRSAGFNDISVMVGFSGERVEEWTREQFPEVNVLWQREQLGTGHAAKLAQEWWKDFKNVVIIPGDTPLIKAETLRKFIDVHIGKNNKCSFLSFDLSDPAGYGRVIRDGLSVRIVEHKDATADERKCREVNSGMYVFDTTALSDVIDHLNCMNSQKEYYLPDAVALIEKNSGRTDAVKASDPAEFLGINDPNQLADAAAVMKKRILDKWMGMGVRCSDPLSTWIGPRVSLGEDIEIQPNVQLWGDTSVGRQCSIGSYTVIQDSVIEDNVEIIGSVRVKKSRIGQNSVIGPFVYIRDEAELHNDVHVGRFVEIKKSTIRRGAKVPHLSYVGDADIGERTNIGAGTITCNYDGEKKNFTKIGSNCFVGSDTMFIAPVTIGDNAVTAAGSVITQDIPEGALGVARAKQKNIEGWSSRRKIHKGGN